MIETFPEIEYFFSKRIFTQDELDEFKIALINKYGGNRQHKKAIESTINIHLIKYKVSLSCKKKTVNSSLNKGKDPFKMSHEDIFYRYCINKPIKKSIIFLGVNQKSFF